MIVRYFFYDFIHDSLSTAYLPDYTKIKRLKNIEIVEGIWHYKVYCKAVKICKGYLIPIDKKRYYSKKVLVILRGGEAFSEQRQLLDLFYYQEAFDISYYLVDVGEKFWIKSKDGFREILMKAIKRQGKVEFKILERK